MRLLIFDECYPHEESLMGAFVHVRAKEYAKKHQIKVFSFFHEPRELTFDGISIEMFNDIEKLVKAAKAFHPDKILIHFYQSWMLESVIKVMHVTVIIWVHGHEALGWYRRLFNWNLISLFGRSLYICIGGNIKQQYHFRRLISYANKTDSLYFVFVSNWMKRMTEMDTLSKVQHFSIIPNPIDINLFDYLKKDVEQRTKVLILRSFTTRKYANDISVKAIIALSQQKEFSNFEFKIIG